MRLLAVVCAVGLAVAGLALAGYKFKPLPVEAASSYVARQEFQKLTIGARTFASESELTGIFDRKDIYKNGYVAVLLVVQNDNDFPVELSNGDIYLVTSEGNRRAVPPETVITRLHGRIPGDTRQKRSVLGALKGNEWAEDLDKKAWGRKIIAPFSSDHGLAYFQHDSTPDFFRGTKLYLPKVYNMQTDQELIFFEFDLMPAGGK
ncbi:MAG: hypothetical protein ACR2L2_08860 [Acidobacteriota bacterium]